MDFQLLQQFVDYNYWARDRVLDAVEPLTPEQFTRTMVSSFPSVRDTLAHLCGAERVWRSRWDGIPAVLPDPSGFCDLAAIRAAWADEEARIRAIVERLGPDGVLQPIVYERAGVREAQPFWQMLLHLVNHGSYHRGQVTTMLRQLGAPPPKSLDLIAFCRERAAVQA